MDIPVAIKVETGDAEAKSRAVETALGKVEERGIAVGKAMAQAGGAFKKLGEALEEERAAAQRTHEIHDRLTRQSQPLAQGFGKLAEMMERERRILESIQGPMREYSSSLAALDQLLAKNTISTAQYAEQVTRLNRELASTPNRPTPSASNPALAMQTVGLPEVQQGPTVMGGARALASSPGLAVGGLVSGALIGGATVLENMSKESDALKDRYTDLTNRASAFATNGRTLNSVIEEQTRLARDLKTEIVPAMDLYNSVGDATRNLGLSTKETVALTRVLGMEMVNNQKPVGEAANLIKRLALGLEIGEGAGRQFKTIMAEYPRLADAMAKGFNTNALGLEKMIGEGTVKLPQLTRAVVDNSEEIVARNKQITETIAQKKAAIIEDAEIAMNRGVPALIAMTEEGRVLSEGLLKIRGGGRALSDVVGEISQDLAEQAKKWNLVREQAEAATGQKIINGLREISNAVDGATASVGRLGVSMANAFATDGFFAVVKAADPWFVKPETPKKIADTNKEIDEYGRLLKSVTEPQRKAIEEYNLLSQALMNHPELYRQISVELGKRRDILLELGAIEAKSQTGAVPTPVDYTAGLQTPGAQTPGAGIDWKTAAEDIKRAGDRVKEMQAALDGVEFAAAQKKAEAFGRVLRPIGDSIIEMFRSGEFSAKKFERVLEDLAIQLLKMAAIQAIGSGGGVYGAFAKGLLGGGKTGFDYTVNNDPFQRPGLRGGGDLVVGGSGGEDSKLAMFWVSPKETISVRTPEQRMASERQTAAVSTTVLPQIVVQMQNDRRDIVEGMDSYDGQRVAVNLDRRLGRRGPGRRR